jgi:hypothetical protein
MILLFFPDGSRTKGTEGTEEGRENFLMIRSKISSVRTFFRMNKYSVENSSPS